MNIAKNMEALFVVAVALAGVTSLATAAVPKLAVPTLAVPKLQAAPSPQLSAPSAAPAAMQTVVIVGKRLSAAEKAAL